MIVVDGALSLMSRLDKYLFRGGGIKKMLTYFYTSTTGLLVFMFEEEEVAVESRDSSSLG
jgi:hypothetical protein